MPEKKRKKPIKFALDAPEARTVSVAGHLDDWNADSYPAKIVVNSR
jgi:hypothetical protein